MKNVTSFIVLAVSLFFVSSCHRGPAYLNPRLPVEKRAMDLVSRMTLDEKISQMMNSAPAIPRLGIPEYDWWSEGLHGVARAGVATVFPQAIGLAAMWDTSTMFMVASVISDEFRAKYNDFVKRNERGIYKGLTVWSPNINIFRDPRWGRGQETYGEDPYLTGCTGVAFVKGLQGSDPVYLKTVSTPKHFAVHSGPEPLRHEFDARISQRDFLETYTPAFEACVREGGAWSVMGAYNRYMGEACCASNVLLKETLRGKWGFKGYVVSDCGAIDDIYMFHKLVTTPEEAAAMAVKAGCDLNCGNTYQYLKQAVEKGLITEAEIDTAVKRLFIARIKLGMFDPEEKVPFNKISIEVNDSKEHRALALEAARKSIVLLRNEGNLLPLKRENLKTIAVIGPNANSVESLYGNYNGVSSHPVTPLEGIQNKVGNSAKVLYAVGCNYTDVTPALSPVPPDWFSFDGKPGLKAEYFANTDLKGQPVVTRTDAQIDFAWD
ncbi:MAG TPA: glycoside hydrolase family 3 N-terminal domain-containing protein, partial [Bacteroidales bacterium]|nr:glycoside hydrolase family 3 N-terminal domain-containing protein [Bacteroidales bacterium]